MDLHLWYIFYSSPFPHHFPSQLQLQEYFFPYSTESSLQYSANILLEKKAKMFAVLYHYKQVEG